MNTVHGNLKIKFNCDICGQELTSKLSIIRHKRAIHEGIKHGCDHCDFKGSEASSLRRHLKNIHKILPARDADNKMV